MTGQIPTISVMHFSDKDSDAVFALVTKIQDEEHGGADSEADAVDLRSITATYAGGASGFWVAKAGNRIVGTAALTDLGDGNAELRRMYVDQAFRGSGIGTARELMRAVVSYAAENDIARIYLGTMDEPVSAPRFYEKSGFVTIDRGSMPADAPISNMDTRFYRLDL